MGVQGLVFKHVGTLVEALSIFGVLSYTVVSSSVKGTGQHWNLTEKITSSFGVNRMVLEMGALYKGCLLGKEE